MVCLKLRTHVEKKICRFTNFASPGQISRSHVRYFSLFSRALWCLCFQQKIFGSFHKVGLEGVRQYSFELCKQESQIWKSHSSLDGRDFLWMKPSKSESEYLHWQRCNQSPCKCDRVISRHQITPQEVIATCLKSIWNPESTQRNIYYE